MKILLIILLILIIFAILDIIVENKWLQVTKTTIKAKVNIKVCVIADLHCYSYGKSNLKLLNEIVLAEPDYVLIPGDLIVKTGKKLNIAMDFLKALSNLKLKTIYCPGNHELKLRLNNEQAYNDYIESIKKLGIIYLDDKVYTDRNINFIGYTNKIQHFKKFRKPYKLSATEISDSVKKPDNKYTILLAHNPIYFDEYASYGADLVVSGHLHGGIIRLPFIGGILSPQSFFSNKYNFGFYRKNDKYMYVSRGLGLHTIPIRMNNRPELAIITLKK